MTKVKNIRFGQLHIHPKVLFMLWMCGIMIVALTYYNAYSETFNFELFWIGIFLSSLSLIGLILDDQIKKYRLILLFILGITFYFPVIFWSPNYFHFGDEILHYQTSRLIQEHGNLDINVNFDVTKYYPGISLVTVFLSEFSDTSIFFSGKFMVGIIHSLMLIFVYLLFERISHSEKIAIFGAIIYATNSRYIFFDGIFSYESMGLPLMILTLFILAKYTTIDSVNNIYFRLLMIILISAIVITHHFTSYMLLLFMIVLLLVIYRKKLDQYIKLDFYVAASLTFMLIFGWMVYYATVGFGYFGGLVRRSFVDIFKMFSLEHVTLRVLYRESPVPYYERFTSQFLYIPLLFALFIIGIYILKRKNRFGDMWTYGLVAYGYIFFMSLLLIFNNSAEMFVYRSWAFLSIGTSFVAAFALNEICEFKIDKYLKTVSLYSVIIILLVGGISAGSSYNFRVPKLNIDSINVAAGHSATTYDTVTTAKWFEKYLGRYNTFYGDRSLGSAIGGYGIQKTPWQSEKIFYPLDMNDKNVTTFIRDRSTTNYIVVDTRITKFLAEYGSYFSEEEKYFEKHYGEKEVFPKERLEKFDKSEFLYRIYSNGNTNIYEIIRKKMPRL